MFCNVFVGEQAAEPAGRRAARQESRQESTQKYVRRLASTCRLPCTCVPHDDTAVEELAMILDAPLFTVYCKLSSAL